MSFLDRFRGREAPDLRQPSPASIEGAGWAVFERLIDFDIKDATSFERMTPEQQAVVGMNLVRQELASGGFEGYFGWYSERPDLIAAAARGFERIAPTLGELLAEALSLRATNGDPDFEALDERFSAAEAKESIDDLVDAYIEANRSGFFA